MLNLVGVNVTIVEISMRFITAAVVALLTLLTLAVPASAQDGVRISLLHGIPDTAVDVVANGEVIVEGFSFGDASDLSALAGQTLSGVELRLAGTDDVAVDVGDLELPSSGSHTVIAHLEEDGTPAATMFENNTAAISAGNGRITVRHTMQAEPVDVLFDGFRTMRDLGNRQEATIQNPAGTLSVEIVPADEDSPQLIGPDEVTVVEGQSLIVYAVGPDTNPTFITETIGQLNKAPVAVETGTSPIEITEFSLARTAALVAAMALALAAFSTRRRWLTS